MMRSMRSQLAEARRMAGTRAQQRERDLATKLPAWRTQHRRRRLIVVLALGYLLMLTSAVLEHLRLTWWYFALTMAGLLIVCASSILLRILTGRPTSSVSSALLDERERELRYRASHSAFQLVCGLLMIAMFYALLVDELVTTEAGVTIFATLVIIGVSSPTVILGWTLPDDSPEEPLTDQQQHGLGENGAW